MEVLYALIWRTPDANFKQEEFDKRIPNLMNWLRLLKSENKLIACGGGGFETESAGLTIIRADDIQDAIRLAEQNPMNDIGRTEVMVWDNYFADFQNLTNIKNLI